MFTICILNTYFRVHSLMLKFIAFLPADLNLADVVRVTLITHELFDIADLIKNLIQSVDHLAGKASHCRDVKTPIIIC